MKDVLNNLAKLPPFCYAVLDDQPVHIRRGAREATPFPQASKEEIDTWNRERGVTEAQKKAMVVGVTLGWDMDGADPDTHTLLEHEKLGDETFSYFYQAEITCQIVVEARSEELAAEEAKLRLSEVCDWLESGDPIPGQVVAYAPSDTIDLVETNDPRP